MQHLDEGTIHAWLDGALGSAEAEQVAEHAAECATCAAAVADARGIIAGAARIVSALDDVPGGVIPGGASGGGGGQVARASMWRRLRLTPARAALAATILLAVSTTLTLRSSSSPPVKSDSVASLVVPKSVSPPAAPLARATMDSIKTPGPSAQVVNASALRKTGVVVPAAPTQTVAERREAVDAPVAHDSAKRVLAKTRATAQELTAAPAAGASAAASPPAAVSTAQSNFAPVKALEQRDSASTFEGCYRVSADSSSGSVEMPQGLPASFSLKRPTAEPRAFARRAAAADVRTDPNASAVVTWRQLSNTQANVMFGTGSARQVLLTLTAGSPVGVASSGDRTTTVRVARASCPP